MVCSVSDHCPCFKSAGVLSQPLVPIIVSPRCCRKKRCQPPSRTSSVRSDAVMQVCPRPPPAGAGKRGASRPYAASPSEPPAEGILKVCGGEGGLCRELQSRGNGGG